jgi:hypothetical protein
MSHDGDDERARAESFGGPSVEGSSAITTITDEMIIAILDHLSGEVEKM